MAIRLLKQFLQLETASGIVLLIAAILSMVIVNSPLAPWYQQIVEKCIFIINEGLMALFFVVVGLELKRGYIDGLLSRFSQVVLPLVAAFGGMLVPALIYCAFNVGDPVTMRGWATPVATDIAFALGVLALLGPRIPMALKLFLLTLAIFDDIGAIIIIAAFYGNGFVYVYLFLAGLITLSLLALNRWQVQVLWPYLILGVLLWCALLLSGIHPTIGGVIFALTIPEKSGMSDSPLRRLEAALHPWVAFFIMPVFALANAGVSLSDVDMAILLDSVVLGIVCGLFVGKQIGVMLFSWVLIRFKMATLPEKTTWAQLYGVALLCGIGFTMSLFLGTLSFANESQYLAEVRLGVLMGSILSGLMGAGVLYFAKPISYRQ